MRSRNIRDDFTDALNEEMLSRKIFDRAKPKVEEEIFLSETKKEETPEPEIEKLQPVRKKENTNSKYKLEKIPEVSKEEIYQPPKIKTPQKIEAETELEKRIFAEAENDFYDEKPAEIGENFRSKISDEERPIFHSKNLKFDTIEDEKDSREPFDPELYRKLTRAEMAGVTLSAIMLMYSFANMDKPLFFMAMSLLTHLMRPLVGAFFGKHNRAVQNAMRSFSWVLFFGALLFIFM